LGLEDGVALGLGVGLDDGVALELGVGLGVPIGRGPVAVDGPVPPGVVAKTLNV
jgi:hypothetical protein